MYESSPIARHLPVMRLAFRSLFLLGALFSLVAMLVWGAFWHGNMLLTPHGGMLWWHQHEMLFGFGAAIAVGFLLTAVQNWTGRPGLHGLPLLGLVSVWLAGRGVLAYPGDLPAIGLAVIDLAFLPLATLVLATQVVRAGQWRNLVFVPVLFLLFLGNTLMHVGLMEGDAWLVRKATQLSILLIALLMVVLGGRVIPFFTSRRLGRPQAARLVWLEASAVGSVAVLVLMQLLSIGMVIPDMAWSIVAALGAVTNTVRLGRWEGLRCLHEPLLWGLHASYAFICLGLAAWAVMPLGWVTPSLALHIIAVGGMATMMLAMMARVALGHTGRTIEALPGIGVALVAMLLAALLRALVPLVWPQVSHWTLSLSILCWLLAFSLFMWRYTLPLMSGRVDGREG